MKFVTHLLLAVCLCILPYRALAALSIYTEEWAPISFSVDGKPDGLAVQVVQEIQKRVKNQDPIKVVPWARGWKIMTEQPNTVLFAMTRTPAREQLFSMIGPIATGTINFYALKDSPLYIGSIDDAKQAKAVGVYRSSVEDQLLMEHQFTNIAPSTTPLLSAKQLMKKRIDLWCNTNLTAPSILAEAGASMDDVKSLYTISENHLYISFSKGTPNKEIEQWKEALIDINADGTFAQIYHRWLPNDAPPMETERVGQ